MHFLLGLACGGLLMSCTDGDEAVTVIPFEPAVVESGTEVTTTGQFEARLISDVALEPARSVTKTTQFQIEWGPEL